MGKYQCIKKRKRRNIETLMKAREAKKKKRDCPENIEVSTSCDMVGSMEMISEYTDDIARDHMSCSTELQQLAPCSEDMNHNVVTDVFDDFVLEVERVPTFREENVNHADIQGSRIIDFQYFMDQLYSIDAHSQKFGCKLNQLMFLKEKQMGFISRFDMKCTMCGSLFQIKTSEEQSRFNKNLSAVSGAIITGVGHSNLNELCASMDLPTIPFRLYKECHDAVAEMWKNTAEETMQRAAEEEAEAAKLRGDINQAGIPMISVQADGCWSKRSYKSNYSALSGVAAIIGEHTGKVLHVGVRNKYCVICARDQRKGVSPRPHKCTKNHSGSSTSMEQAILVEGFKKSINTRKLIYKTMIADGDSSTYKNILESRPYPDVPIQKIECTNHLLRNYNGKNLKLLSDTSIPHTERKLLTVDRQTRLRTAIRSAIKYRKAENGTVAQKILSIQKDIINSPRHVFGDHRKCDEYYCKDERKNERDLTSQAPTLMLRLQKNAAQLAHNSRSLLHYSTSNRAEQFNSIVAKAVGGKRVNFSLKNSYEARCYAAVVSFNTGKPQYTLYKSISQRSPGKSLKRLEFKREARNIKIRSKKQTKRSRKRINFDHTDYGRQCQRPDMSTEDFENAKTLFLNNLRDQAANRHEIERATILQAESALWLELRRCILTASTFAKVCKRRPNQNSAPLVKTILYSYNLDNVSSIKHGRDNETKALVQLSRQENIVIEKCGLFIDPNHCYLGASPDGLYSEGLVEVKCPISAFGMDFDEAVRIKKVRGFTCNGFAGVTINRNHDWFYQIQGQLFISKKEMCMLAIWTGSDHPVKVIKIHRDENFWQEKMLPKLKAFYEKCVLPEIIDSRKARSMPLREIYF